jgi:hypothetical protein|tara:strand:- start:601 stop:774 length:174 start_codon:yes stop_codon:yes gene_type:complete
MNKEELKEVLVKFCMTEKFGACDIKQWVEDNGITFKERDTIEQIESRVDYFIENEKG